MRQPILYYAKDCPDTAPFVAALAALNIEYQAVEILENLANFKQFLRLRDRHSAFDHAKENGTIGIPALVWKDEIYLDVDELAYLFK
ncbi:hypothetical protein ACFFHK_06355 [Gallibacterium trehalosifermentans]|uniref:Glutaredoxin n=1 Tax=Gallibacterium trehalosifermentans TaxID=516935 RepID=A0ABV6H142_9PAST